MGRTFQHHDDLIFKDRIQSTDESIFAFAALSDESDSLVETPDVARESGANAGIRFVAIGNLARMPVSDFIFSTFGPVRIHAVTADDLRGFSTRLGAYSVLVVLVDDVVRAKRVLREVRPLIANKLCYAIMTESTPQTRTALIRAMFDDVFDTRTKPQEILTRIAAHQRRQACYNAKAVVDHRFEAFCEENVSGTVHSQQVPVLKRLFDSMGHVVRYRDLAAYDFHSGEFRVESLTVRIHNLRRKLKNYDIRCTRGAGYALVKTGG